MQCIRYWLVVGVVHATVRRGAEGSSDHRCSLMYVVIRYLCDINQSVHYVFKVWWNVVKFIWAKIHLNTKVL